MNKLGSICLAGLVATGAMACGGDDEDKQPVKLGLAAPFTGEESEFGPAFEDVMRVAIEDINERGGVNGHMLELEVGNTEADPEVAKDVVQSLIDAGVVAIVGPLTSSSAAAVFEMARDAKVPLISPSSTAPSLIDAMDDGYLFRNVPNDNVQSVAIAYYLKTIREPNISEVLVVHDSGDYGRGLAMAFEEVFKSSALGGTVPMLLEFDEKLGDGTEARMTEIMDALNAADPEMVFIAAQSGGSAAVLARWAELRNMPGYEAIQDQRWFLADGGKASLVYAAAPEVLVGTEGTAPTSPTRGDAQQVLEDTYKAARPEGKALNTQFANNVWDATYVLALALLKQSVEKQDFGGEGLRDAITDVSGSPGQVKDAGQWSEIVSLIKRGTAVNYDGAAGPVDLDADGETVGPYEVWRIASVGANGTAERAKYLEITVSDSGAVNVVAK